MEYNFNCYPNSKQNISFCEVDKCPAVRRLRQCLIDIREIAKEKLQWCEDNKKNCTNCEYACKEWIILEKIEEQLQ